MRWEDESWVKLYTRDSGDWLFLSFDSQALFLMLLRKVDRHGVLELGRNGAKALASVLGHNNAEQRITTACNALIEDGCITLEAGTLTIVNFKEAQAAKTSSAERSRRFVGLHGKRNAQQRATTRNNDQTRLDKTRSVTTLSDSHPTDPVSSLPDPPKSKPDAVRAVFEHWRVKHRVGRKALLDTKRRTAIEGQLKLGRSVDDLCRAVEGCLRDPFNMGQNDRGKKFNDIALICRDAAHVEQFMALCPQATGPPAPPKKTDAQIQAEAIADYERQNGRV